MIKRLQTTIETFGNKTDSQTDMFPNMQQRKQVEPNTEENHPQISPRTSGIAGVHHLDFCGLRDTVN